MTTAEKSRGEMIALRKKRSLTWRIIHVLGSLRIALLLLATIAIACATATICESRFDTKVAQAYIYKAPWFMVWLGVLCINLFAVTLTRWPWQRKHLGFVITHYGIITLLIGAMIGSRFGYEGNVTLHRGEPPLDRITVNRTMLRVDDPQTGRQVLVPFDPQLSRPSEKRPCVIALPDTAPKISMDGVSNNLVRTEKLIFDSNGQPGLEVAFATKMMGQNLSMPFVLGSNDKADTRDFFGLAKVAFVPLLPKREPLDIGESQVVFSKLAPVIQGDGDKRTGIQIRLSPDGTRMTVALPDGKSAEYSRAEIQGKPQRLGDATFSVADYWPDFVIKNGRPQSAGMLPNNPAVLVRITAPPAPTSGERPQPLLEITFRPDDGIAYQISRGGRLKTSGTAKVGESFALGWADWTATVTRSLSSARIVNERVPGPAGEEGTPGFRARLVLPDGRDGTPHWLALGDTEVLSAGDEFLEIIFGYELRPIPFTIALKNFEVPRVEGSDEPANFIATVEFRDTKTGTTKEGVAQMNHPASWPGTAFSVTTGLNYKFSQASWVPEDLNQTTLQVLYDPGWLFKWTGSLAIIIGIFIMFYLRPKRT
ncbi:MAG: cytochrome C biogenesis protein ResB [Chthoniobacterales bacterium]